METLLTIKIRLKIMIRHSFLFHIHLQTYSVSVKIKIQMCFHVLVTASTTLVTAADSDTSGCELKPIFQAETGNTTQHWNTYENQDTFKDVMQEINMREYSNNHNVPSI